jgi:hypothetical protein
MWVNGGIPPWVPNLESPLNKELIGSEIQVGLGAVEAKENPLSLMEIQPRFIGLPASSHVTLTTESSPLLLIGYDVYLLQIEMPCLKTDRFTDVTIHLFINGSTAPCWALASSSVSSFRKSYHL